MSATVSSSDNPANLSVDSTTSEELLRMNEDEFKQQLEGFNKFEQLKKNSSKNRMDSFRDNISKLDTCAANAAANESPVKVDGKRIPSSPWKKSTTPWNTVGDSKKKNDGRVWQSNSNFLATNFFTTNNPSQNLQNDYFYQISSNPQRSQDQQKSTKSNNNNKKINKNNSNLVNKRSDSELCGLKVHYRQSGTESSSEDDDADVVVEEEYNDYDSMSDIPVNVSQFLSSPVQSSPSSLNTQPSTVKPMRVKSPVKSPQKNLHDVTVEKIKAAIAHGDKIIVLMRGLPGSGKSTEARNLISSTLAKDPSIYVFSTDDFFQLHNRGVYTYDPTKLSEAHSRNHSRVSNAMKSGRTPIIVDNTNLQIWEMRPYVIMAADNGYIIEVLETNTPWAYNVNELARKNTHGVPKEKIRIMLDRYEKGITGQKLMDIYSLKYPNNFNPIIKTPTQSPTINSTKEELVEKKSIDQRIENNKVVQDNKNSFSKYLQSLALPEVLPELNEVSKINIEELGKEKTDGVKPDDSQMLQPLGAIGSERKNSVVHLDLISPVRETDEIDREVNDNFNILPPCWDFTLLLDGKTLHSNHLEEEYFYEKPKGSPVDADEIRKQDEEFGKEGNSGKVSPLFTEEESYQESEKSCDGMEDFIKELAKEYNETSGFDVKESTVIITEIIDDDELSQLPDNNTDSSEEVKKDCVDTVTNDESEEVDKEKEDNISDNEELHSSDEDVMGLGESKEKIPWPDVDCLDIDSEFLDDSVDDTIGDESLSDDDAREALKESALIGSPELNVLEDKNEEIKEATKAPVTFGTIGSIFNIIKTSILGESSVGGANIDSNLEKKFQLEDQKENSELLDLEASDKETTKIDELVEEHTKELMSENLDTLNAEEDKIDNINSITWKESPFPLDDVPSMKLILNESLNKKIISTNDAGTNTSYYDFNVLFVGGTADANYRVIDTLNRSINEGMPLVQSERPPVKLMLDKSSMTDDMLNRDVEVQQDNSASSICQLVNLFPNIPRDYLIDMYENLCHKDFNWTVDVLLDGMPQDGSIDMHRTTEEEKTEEGNEDNDQVEDSSSKTSTAELFDLFPEKKVKTSQENLEKTFLNEEEKQEAILSEKKNENDKEEFRLQEIESVLNNKTDTDIFDDISSHSTASTSRTDSIENDKSSEDEETVELNLGFDGIRVLENLFSNPDFLIPDGFMPVIQVKKSMAKELYALWIESMYTQLTSRHEQLDNMIAKDAEYAKNLEKQLEEEACASSNEVSNLQESMDLELALKSYNDAVKETVIEDSPDDVISQLSRQALYESLPGIDPKALDEVFSAHGHNLKETFEIIKASTGRSIAAGVTREETFVDKVKANISNNSSEEKLKARSITPVIAARPDSRNSPKIESKNDKIKVQADVDNAKQEAQRRFSLQIENFNKAAEAYRRGCPAVAAYYSEVSRQHARYNKEARADAASAMVEAQILDNEDILDLHYLVVHDAIIALDTFLDYHLNKLIKNNKRYATVYIVTGRGSRSTSKMSRIKPAVSRNLINRNIRFSEANPGCLKVTLHRKNGTD
ncbi:NEDD4-binding protein 2-like isoform X2 [Cotesia glomerata]|nr:NEDD4-binding protein 2-like isoform X2 [Cotesia glomerata]